MHVRVVFREQRAPMFSALRFEWRLIRLGHWFMRLIVCNRTWRADWALDSSEVCQLPALALPMVSLAASGATMNGTRSRRPAG